jgi:hypothetical protein
VLPPPYKDEDKFVLRYRPPGATKYATGKGSMYRTLEIIGTPPAKDVDVNIGWAQVHISKTGKLSVVAGEGANIGKREETIGMGEGQIPIEVAKVAKQEGISKEELIETKKETGEYGVEDLIEEEQPQEVQTTQIRGESSNELNKVLLNKYTNGLKVYTVNGQYVRDNLDIDFTQGGHYKVYPFIPENEIWIDDILRDNDRDSTKLHEIAEVASMPSKGFVGKDEEYETAHNDVANVIERQARANPEELPEMIGKAIATYEKSRRTRKPRNFEKQMEEEWEDDESGELPVRRTRRKIETSDTSGIRDQYYLGKKLSGTPIDVSI